MYRLPDIDNKLEKAAMKYTLALEKEKFNVAHHDVGFMTYCSFQVRDILQKLGATSDLF